MNYSYIKVFYTVAMLQNISKAADNLGVTQPAVSRIIGTIEKEYKTTLFNRSKNGVSLTKEGQILFDMIKGPFAELNRIDESITHPLKEATLTVHVGATSTALYCYLFKYLEEIKRTFPTVKFRIYTDSSSNLSNMVLNGEIDFGFVTTPFDGSDDLEIHNIYELNNILVAPISYKDKIQGKVSIKSLIQYPFILLNKDMQFREHINKYLKDNGAKINPAYEVDSSSVLIPLVENDCGLTFIPEDMAIKSINEKQCFKVDLIEDIPIRYVTFLTKRSRTNSPIIDEIKESIIKAPKK